MASPKKTQDASSSTSQHASHLNSPNSPPTGRAPHSSSTKRSRRRTTTTPAFRASYSTASLMSAPLQVYLHSSEPVDRLVKATFTSHHHNQHFGTQGQSEQDVGRDDGTEALDRWMKVVTAHPEHTALHWGLERVVELMTNMYDSLPSTGGDAGYNDRLHRVPSQESMQPACFCYCCPPYSADSRS